MTEEILVHGMGKVEDRGQGLERWAPFQVSSVWALTGPVKWSEERESSPGRTSTLLKNGVSTSIIMIEIIVRLGLIKVFFL